VKGGKSDGNVLDIGRSEIIVSTSSRRRNSDIDICCCE